MKYHIGKTSVRIPYKVYITIYSHSSIYKI
uniref:Uncharacterized protein n=1 Tax=Podoviridae sp. ctPr92 TaxID=2825247 RepID=A0A8S5P6P6_9CAUD|nr:MAG TPA: hypothetical protein [Podoviridae sp. ctPr92]